MVAFGKLGIELRDLSNVNWERKGKGICEVS